MVGTLAPAFAVRALPTLQDAYAGACLRSFSPNST